MKKLTYFLFTLMVISALLCTACQQEQTNGTEADNSSSITQEQQENTVQAVSTYRLIHMVSGKEEFDKEKLDEYGLQATVTINSDGTGSIIFLSSQREVTFYDDRFTYSDTGDSVSYSLGSDLLECEIEGNICTFQKQ